MKWCNYFLKHTSVLPLLGTEAPISRKVNQSWDFLLSFTGREPLSTWRQQPSGLKSKYKEGSALSWPNHHKHDFSHTGNHESPMITHSPGSIFCFSAHLVSSYCQQHSSINQSFLDHSYQDTNDLLSFLKLYLKSTSLRCSLIQHTPLSIQNSLSKYTAMNNISQSSLCPCGTTLTPDVNPS